MSVVITGATGHIGGNLTRALLEQGRRVRVLLHDDPRALRGLDVETATGDVLDPESLRRAFAGAEVVYHLAARISIVGDRDGMVHRTNVIGTRNVVSACLQSGVRRLVHFSSIHALSQHPLHEPLDESRAPPRGRRCLAYDRSKAAGEAEVLLGVKQGLDAVIVNPAGVVGRHDYKPSAMGQVFLDLYRRRLPALVRGGFNWVDVRDVVAGALAAEERGRTGERYLLAGHWHSIPELAAWAGEVTGVKPPIFVSPLWLARLGVPFATGYSRLAGTRPLFTRDSLEVLKSNRQVRRDKAERELSYRPRPIRESVADIYRWFDEAGRLS